MKFIILIIAVISTIAFSSPISDDSYEYEDFESEIFDYTLGRSEDLTYMQRVKNYMKNMKDSVKNSKFYHRCIKFNNTVEPDTTDDYDTETLKNQTSLIPEPTSEQKEGCWKYLKNKGSKAKKWFTGWFSTTQDESNSINDEAEQIKSENETIASSPTKPNDEKIYYPGYEEMFPTQKSPGFWEKTFG